MCRKFMLTVRNKTLFLWFLLIFLSLKGFSQSLYFVSFTDKNDSGFLIQAPEKFLSPKAIERRSKQKITIQENDLPVNASYLNSLVSQNARIVRSSKWLNGALVEMSAETADLIQQLPFIKKITYLQYFQSTNLRSSSQLSKDSSFFSVSRQTSVPDYGQSDTQLEILGIKDVHAAGFTGNTKLIAILDNGFLNADKLSFLNHLYQSGRVENTYDFVDSEVNVYDNGDHGVNVLSVVGGFESGQIVGTAYDASYLLLRTENDFSETIQEEYNWLFAAEYADSAGADIITSSLGYTTFDYPEQNHTYADLDGKTTVITLAAEIAFSKGMVVANSAGNDGNNSWKYISAPADGPSVLAVGAVNGSKSYANFSSIGPSADGRIKPDVVAMGAGVFVGNPDNSFSYTNGTSFSCPMVAGFIACLWQARPELSNAQIIDAIRKTSSLSDNPDYKYGYGIPNFAKASIYFKEDTLNAQFFPNPLSLPGQVNIVVDNNVLGQNLSIDLYDITGKNVFSSLVGSAEKINNVNFPGDLQCGVFFLEIKGQNARRIVKILLQ